MSKDRFVNNKKIVNKGDFDERLISKAYYQKRAEQVAPLRLVGLGHNTQMALAIFLARAHFSSFGLSGVTFPRSQAIHFG